MRFELFVLDREHQRVPVSIELMTQVDAESTDSPPAWQTSWTSEYLADDRFEKYAAKTSELARHYERNFGAVRLPMFDSSAPRYLIADEAAKRIFFTYLV